MRAKDVLKKLYTPVTNLIGDVKDFARYVLVESQFEPLDKKSTTSRVMAEASILNYIKSHPKDSLKEIASKFQDGKLWLKFFRHQGYTVSSGHEISLTPRGENVANAQSYMWEGILGSPFHGREYINLLKGK